MFLCYLDESGVPEIGQGTSHYVLLGFAIQVWDWKGQDGAVADLKKGFDLESAEIHAGWIFRRYGEQEHIPGFEVMDREARRKAVLHKRNQTLQKLGATKGHSAVRETRKTFRKTEPYIHLTYAQRQAFLQELADLVGSWGHTRIFADAIDKTSFGRTPPVTPPREEAFHQIVNRFQRMLDDQPNPQTIGLLVHDNDETNAERLTELMRHFHRSGTLFNPVTRIIETPFFVDSRLTVGVQIADLCAFATRRFFENGETDLFDRIYSRFNRVKGRLVGLRHYCGQRDCDCKVCVDTHKKPVQLALEPAKETTGEEGN
jgi:Protein of unknown function (DUF3800)